MDETAVGLLETTGWTPAMVALDAMEKSAPLRVLQAELNDFLGVCIKMAGPVATLECAIEQGRQIAEAMGGQPRTRVIGRYDDRAFEALQSPPEYNPLIQQPVVTIPHQEIDRVTRTIEALGFIETQGFTAVFDAIDTACKAADVRVIGKEKLGGGYVTVVIEGDVAAVQAAIEAGQLRVESLGRLIAAHVVTHPSPAVLGLLPAN